MGDTVFSTARTEEIQEQFRQEKFTVPISVLRDVSKQAPLNGQALVYDSVTELYVPTNVSTNAVTSVNGDTGPAVSLTSTDIPEGSNLYFTDVRVLAAISASPLTDIYIATGAAINRNKLASGSNNRVVVNDSSGVMSDAPAITAARALISDGFGIPTHANVTSTELDYLTGVTSGVQGQLNARELIANKGAANGYAPLGADTKIPTSYLPALAITDTFVVASQAAQVALTAERGDVAVRTDQNKSYILTTDDPTVFGNWQELLTPTDAVLSVNGYTGAVSLTKTDIGLGSVTNALQLVAANNLSDLTNVGTARTSLGLGALAVLSVATADTGGTGQTSYTVGDLLYAGGVTTLLKLASVGTGAYLRAGGVGIAPLWSTLILPNAATANYVPYATASNAWGESANLQFDGLNLGIGIVPVAKLDVAQDIKTSGSPTILRVDGAAHTTLTAGTEARDVYFNLARTVQFATGAITTQRAVLIAAPTYAFVGASTITQAMTVDISGAPDAGANATITTPIALRVMTGPTNGVGITVRATNAGQTAELQRWQSSGGTSLISINSAGQLRAADGTVSNPGISFIADTDTGIRRVTTNTIAINTAGVDMVTIDTAAVTITEAKNIVLGTATGTKIGTATTQKLGFWNAVPVIQPAHANQAAITDSTGGTASFTLVDVGVLPTQANINDNFATLNRQLDAIRTALVNTGIIKGAT